MLQRRKKRSFVVEKVATIDRVRKRKDELGRMKKKFREREISIERRRRDQKGNRYNRREEERSVSGIIGIKGRTQTVKQAEARSDGPELERKRRRGGRTV